MVGQGINGTISNPADWTISEPLSLTISGFARRYPRALRLADVEEERGHQANMPRTRSMMGAMS